MMLFAQAEGGGDHGALINFIIDAPFFAVLLFVMTFAAVTLLVWRIILNFNFKTDMNQFLPRFQDVLNKEGVEGAIRFCKAQPQSEGIPRKLFVAGLENAKSGLAAMRRAMMTVVEMEIIPDLNFLLTLILAIAKIATMVGLLATIVSMIGTFEALGKAAASGGGGGQAQASSQIGLALFGTMFGLMTAIPLVFAHVLFKAWIHKQELKMKGAMQKLLLLVQAAKNQPPAAAGAARPAAAAPVAARAVTGG
jgi:biopolymer transport protein ExbB